MPDDARSAPGSVPRASLQDRYAPQLKCFGCGPQNEHGLRIQSFVTDKADEVVCEWTPQERYEAFPGMVNGGILGTLFDCHCNWAAAWHLMRQRGVETPPCTVTAEFHVRLRRPTPSSGSLRIVARVVESTHDRATVEAQLDHSGVQTATCRGVFVAVKEDHPAFHRW